MDRDSGVRAAVAGLTAAADEDRATGGVDLERGIYPVIKICTASGHSDATEDEIASCYRSILEARTAGGNL
jgi:proteasome beta subunit